MQRVSIGPSESEAYHVIDDDQGEFVRFTDAQAALEEQAKKFTATHAEVAEALAAAIARANDAVARANGLEAEAQTLSRHVATLTEQLKPAKT